MREGDEAATRCVNSAPAILRVAAALGEQGRPGCGWARQQVGPAGPRLVGSLADLPAGCGSPAWIGWAIHQPGGGPGPQATTLAPPAMASASATSARSTPSAASLWQHRPGGGVEPEQIAELHSIGQKSAPALASGCAPANQQLLQDLRNVGLPWAVLEQRTANQAGADADGGCGQNLVLTGTPQPQPQRSQALIEAAGGKVAAASARRPTTWWPAKPPAANWPKPRASGWPASRPNRPAAAPNPSTPALPLDQDRLRTGQVG